MKRATKPVFFQGVVLVLILSFSAGCASLFWPSTFEPGDGPGWVAVPVSSRMSYDEAWEQVLHALAKRFDLEMISHPGGYIRTAWMYNWVKPGREVKNYRVRAIVKFSPDKRHVGIKAEAQQLDGSEWVIGTDAQLEHVVRTDIFDVVSP